ncbi:MAG: tyrosine recombinase XerD [Chloroflexi bacterium]|nr:MAG: tyrosine recombinase XerD [Chloroflexota bacterium]
MNHEAETCVESFIEQYLEYLAAEKGYAENTLAAYRNDLRQFYLFVVNTRPDITSWARVDSLLLQAYLLDLKARRYSASSVARKVAALKSFYFYLTQRHVLAVNPTLDLDPPRVSKTPPRTLNPEQVTALLNAPAEPTPKGLRDRAMLEVMYATGLRVTELVTLQLTDFNAAARTLRVGRGLQERTLELTNAAHTALEIYLARSRANFGAPPDSGALFVNPRGEPLTRQGVWLILKHYVAQAGIAGAVTPHSLRHAFATHRLQEGSSLQDVQRLLGHAHISSTQLYNRGQATALTVRPKSDLELHEP